MNLPQGRGKSQYCFNLIKTDIFATEAHGKKSFKVFAFPCFSVAIKKLVSWKESFIPDGN